jgi:hypothetical protein
MDAIEKPFGDCTLSYLEDTFGIRPARTTEELNSWLNTNIELNELEKRDVAFFQDGCVVAGQNWYFITLLDRQYCISPAYSALTDEVFFIFNALKSLKLIVQKLTSMA